MEREGEPRKRSRLRPLAGDSLTVALRACPLPLKGEGWTGEKAFGWPVRQSAVTQPDEKPAVTIQVIPYAVEHEPELLALSLRAWAPVFEQLRPAVQSFVYDTFYPEGWRVRQADDIRAFLRTEGKRTWVAVEADLKLGWIGIRLHSADRMGEIHIIAVDPDHQRRGVARALIEHAMSEMRRAGMDMVMVETGDDPGHDPSRQTYERAGFQRWPVARYFREL